MPATAGFCTSFMRELLCGIHALGTSVVRASTAADEVKAALYTNAATIGPSTTAYTATGEAAGTGYTAGGIAITNTNQPAADTTLRKAYWSPSATIAYTGVTLSGVTAVLLYNSTQANRAIGVWTMASQSVVSGTLTITLPAHAAGTALLQLG